MSLHLLVLFHLSNMVAYCLRRTGTWLDTGEGTHPPLVRLGSNSYSMAFVFSFLLIQSFSNPLLRVLFFSYPSLEHPISELSVRALRCPLQPCYCFVLRDHRGRRSCSEKERALPCLVSYYCCLFVFSCPLPFIQPPRASRSAAFFLPW